MRSFIPFSRIATIASIAILGMACTGPQDCTQIEAPAVIATILGAATNQPIPAAVSGTLTQGSTQIAFSPYRPGESVVAYAEPGTYAARLTAPGYSAWDSTLSIRRDEACGGSVTASITIRLVAQ